VFSALTSLVTIAQADAITFGFFGGKGTPVNIDTTGVSLVNGQLLGVKDTTTNSVTFLTGAVKHFDRRCVELRGGRWIAISHVQHRLWSRG
jgi:hypothetical protein